MTTDLTREEYLNPDLHWVLLTRRDIFYSLNSTSDPIPLENQPRFKRADDHRVVDLNTFLIPEVHEWIVERSSIYELMMHRGVRMESHGPNTPKGVVWFYRWYVGFKDPNLAMLFKLVWGGNHA